MFSDEEKGDLLFLLLLSLYGKHLLFLQFLLVFFMYFVLMLLYFYFVVFFGIEKKEIDIWTTDIQLDLVEIRLLVSVWTHILMKNIVVLCIIWKEQSRNGND